MADLESADAACENWKLFAAPAFLKLLRQKNPSLQNKYDGPRLVARLALTPQGIQGSGQGTL
jgi:hypothetical protein